MVAAAENVLIRPAGAADVRAVAEFQVACWREAYRGVLSATYLDAMTVEQRIADWHPRIVAGTRRVALAQRAGVVLGVVSWTVEPSTTELRTLYVAAAEHGTGLAARLVEVSIGSDAAELWVFSANARAQAFYRKHGFAPDGLVALDEGTGLTEQHWVRTGVRSGQ